MIPVDAVDRLGRRYLEVRPFPPGELTRSFAATAPDACEACGAAIRHGFDRYFQRNDARDGTEGGPLARQLMDITYDPVCGPCGDAAIRGRADG